MKEVLKEIQQLLSQEEISDDTLVDIESLVNKALRLSWSKPTNFGSSFSVAATTDFGIVVIRWQLYRNKTPSEIYVDSVFLAKCDSVEEAKAYVEGWVEGKQN